MVNIIGEYCLCPNRSVDILLDHLQANLVHFDAYEIVLQQISQIQGVPITQLIPKFIKFKLQMFTEFNEELSQGFLALIALLLKKNLISLKLVWQNYFKIGSNKWEKKLKEIYDGRVQAASFIFKRANLVRVSGNDKEEEKEEEKMRKKIVGRELKQPLLELMSQLIKINDWKDVETIFSYLKDCFDPTLSYGLIQILTQFLEWFITPMASKWYSLSRNLSDRSEGPIEKLFLLKRGKMSFESEDPSSLQQAHSVEHYEEGLPRIIRIVQHWLSSPGAVIKLITSLCTYLNEVTRPFLLTEQVPQEINQRIIKAQNLCLYVIKTTILPAISQQRANPGPAFYLFKLLSLKYPPPGVKSQILTNKNTWLPIFPPQKRYECYQHWMDKVYSYSPKLVIIGCQMVKDIRHWQRRFCKENAKQLGRQLAKLTHNNPCIALHLCISQALTYDNQIEALITAVGFCSRLSLDIFAFLIVRMLADDSQTRLDQSDGLIGSNLSSLSTLTGLYFKKHPNVDLMGIFLFLINSLRRGDQVQASVQTVILKELISKMSGWTSIELEQMSEEHLQSLAGGFTLRIETASLMQDYRSTRKCVNVLTHILFDKMTRNNTEYKRSLRSELKDFNQVSAENNIDSSKYFAIVERQIQKHPISLSLLLVIYLAKNRESLLYDSETKYVKLISTLYDRQQLLFIQFVEFLTFYTGDRGFFYQDILPQFATEILGRIHKLDPATIFYIIRPGLKALNLKNRRFQLYCRDFPRVLNDYYERAMTENKFESEYFDQSKYLSELYGDGKVWKSVTHQMYTLFWVLQLKDIWMASQRYENEITNVKTKLYELQGRDGMDESGNMQEDGQANNPGSKQIKKDKDRLNSLQKSLEAEYKNIKERSEGVSQFIDTYLEGKLFAGVQPDQFDQINFTFIQVCLHPRLLFSPADAIYSAKFILLLQKKRIYPFNFVDCIKKLICTVLPCIKCCTQLEAFNLGIFFLEIFRALERWGENEELWKKECEKSPGFAKSVGSKEHFQNFASYKEFLVTIQKSVAVVLMCSLNSEEFMQARNALLLLNRLSTVYPKTKAVTQEILNSLGRLVESAKEEDLKLMANQYMKSLEMKLQDIEFQESGGKEAKDKYEDEEVKVEDYHPRKEGRYESSRYKRDDDSRLLKKRSSPTTMGDMEKGLVKRKKTDLKKDRGDERKSKKRD